MPVLKLMLFVILNITMLGIGVGIEALQLLLVAGVVVVTLANIGVLAWVPRYVERRIQQRQLTTSKTYDVHIESTKLLTEIDMNELSRELRKQLTEVGKKSAQRLQESLDNTVDRLASTLDEQTSTQLSQEFEKYEVSLQALRDQSIAEFDKLQKELEKRKNELMEHLELEITKEKEHRATAINNQLSDVVSSYLVETLGDQVDLGAQATYIFAALQQHKDDIKRDMLA